MPATYTVKQVSGILGYSTNSIYTFLKEKRIKGVRVGRGRFRIPQSELDRLLLVSNKTAIATTANSKSAGEKLIAPTYVSVPDGTQVIRFSQATGGTAIGVPDIIDWLAGYTGIVIGLFMLLFSRSAGLPGAGSFGIWLPVIGTTLMASGIGVLYADFTGKSGSIWHRVFSLTVAIIFLIISYIYWTISDNNGSVLFGILGITFLVRLILRSDALSLFTYAMLAVFGLMPVSIIRSGQAAIFRLPGDLQISWTVWLAFSFITGLILYWSRRNNLHFYRIMLGLIGLTFAFLSITHAVSALFCHAFIFLVLAVLTVFASVWQMFAFTHRSDRKFIFGMLGFVLAVLVATVGIVRMMESTVITFAGAQSAGKVIYAGNVIDSTIDRIKINAETAAVNPLLIRYLTGNETEGIGDFARSMYAARSNIKRIVVADPAGLVLAVYPLEATGSAALTYRDYFARAVSTRRTVTTDSTPVAGADRNSVTVASPVITADKDIAGVVLVQLDLEALGYRLQQLATPESGEYIGVTDPSGRWLIHPDGTLVGSPVAESDIASVMQKSDSGVTEGLDATGVRTALAYTVSERNKWRVGVFMPVRSVIADSNTMTIPIVAVMVIAVMLVILLALLRRNSGTPGKDSS